MTSRRDFFQKLAAVTAGIVVAKSSQEAELIAAKEPAKIGMQLWSVREDVQKDLPRCINALAEIGFTHIEPYGFDGGFYGYEADEFVRICAQKGLKIKSTHTGITKENAAIYADKAAAAGLEYLILPSLMGRPENSIDDFKKTAEEMNLIGDICRKAGIAFGYHNHDFEFRAINGIIPYDILLSETNKELVTFQLDIYWMVKAGFKPIDYFNRHQGRFALWHVKDMANDGESCIVGNGKINFVELLNEAKKSGLKHLVYEQEQYAEGNAIYCAGQSFKYMKKHLALK